MAWRVVSRSGLFAVALSLAAMPASAELVLPPGFGVHVYVSGDGFEESSRSGGRRRGVAAARLGWTRGGGVENRGRKARSPPPGPPHRGAAGPARAPLAPPPRRAQHTEQAG